MGANPKPEPCLLRSEALPTRWLPSFEAAEVGSDDLRMVVTTGTLARLFIEAFMDVALQLRPLRDPLDATVYPLSRLPVTIEDMLLLLFKGAPLGSPLESREP